MYMVGVAVRANLVAGGDDTAANLHPMVVEPV